MPVHQVHPRPLRPHGPLQAPLPGTFLKLWTCTGTMADPNYYELLVKHLKGSRQKMVDELMGEQPPTPQHFQDLANLNQAIVAVESVIAEQEAASGGLPLRRT
jgi:hypothetical protein